MDKIKVGIIGCGNIFGSYAQVNKVYHQIEIVGCADIIPEKAKAAETEFGIKAYNSPEELLANDEIEIVVNITVPKVHAQVDKEILNAGKHVFSEKPLGVNLEEAKEVLDLAKEKGLRVGCAPDTFIGGGLQTAMKVLREGWIGKVVGVSANCAYGGPMGWHPNPDFFYKQGAGPLLDLGPYYITGLIAMFGPIKSVTAVCAKQAPKKLVTFPIERVGEYIDVEVPQHMNAIFEFYDDVTACFTLSFDAPGGNKSPRYEIYGSKGTLYAPDPNAYGAPVLMHLTGQEEVKLPFTHNFTESMRGLGVADMAMAIKENRPHRASGELAYHALDVMLSVYKSSEEERKIYLSSKCEKPAFVPEGLIPGFID